MIVILNVSHSIFSLARYSGGIKYNGNEYIYIPIHDALIMKKYLKEYKKHKGTWNEFIETLKNHKNEKQD